MADQHELLWAVLRLGRPLGLDAQDLLRCYVSSRALREAVWPHVTELDCLDARVTTQCWWQPARLCSVTEACLDFSTVPQLPALGHLRVLTLEGASGNVVDLSPLSSLVRMEKLYVRVPATGVDALALPLLQHLQVHPGTTADMLALAAQTQLTSLALAHLPSDAGLCQQREAYTEDAFSGICRLTGLEFLNMLTWHLPLAGGGRSLAALSSLDNLELGCFACACRDDEPDLSGLSALTQLTALRLTAPQAWHYAGLDLALLPGLDTLHLRWPGPFQALCPEFNLELPHFAAPVLVLSFLHGWQDAVEVLCDVRAAHKHWRRLGAASFDLLDIEEWPQAVCPAEIQAGVKDILASFERHDVEVQSAAALQAGDPNPVRVAEFGLRSISEILGSDHDNSSGSASAWDLSGSDSDSEDDW